jgi:hypothetical protein
MARSAASGPPPAGALARLLETEVRLEGRLAAAREQAATLLSEAERVTAHQA